MMNYGRYAIAKPERHTSNFLKLQGFKDLPDVSKIEFQIAPRKPLEGVLPHLPDTADKTASPVSLIDGLLSYPPEKRPPASECLQHPWFKKDLLIPTTYPNLQDGNNGTIFWEEKTLAEWLHPALKREANRVTRIDT